MPSTSKLAKPQCRHFDLAIAPLQLQLLLIVLEHYSAQIARNELKPKKALVPDMPNPLL
jgi:hypothetical protein